MNLHNKQTFLILLFIKNIDYYLYHSQNNHCYLNGIRVLEINIEKENRGKKKNTSGWLVLFHCIASTVNLFLESLVVT